MRMSLTCTILLLTLWGGFFPPVLSYGIPYDDLLNAPSSSSDMLALCPDLDLKVYVGSAPLGQKEAGKYSKKPEAKDMDTCTLLCCQEDFCNVAFMFDDTCFLITCKSNSACEPVKGKKENIRKKARMVLVRPVPETDYDSLRDDYQADESAVDSTTTVVPGGETCLVGIDTNCQANEECVRVQPNNRSRSGICQCVKNYQRNREGSCVPQVEKLANPSLQLAPLNKPLSEERMSELGAQPSPSPTPVPTEVITNATKGHLVTKILSKEIRLPDNEASLSVFTVPVDEIGDHYVYDWKMVSHPEQDKGNMKGQNTNTISLSDLVEGVYVFKVTVTTPTAQGEAYANVTVLPKKRLNKPPVAVITPESQTVMLPNTGAVLDGSSSTDDDRIVSYKWELQQGPIGYQPKMEDTPTLQLKDLIPGNYTFKLTVEDSSEATNWTVANITVAKETDYPPTANAGQNLIVYLPKTEVTLNGNKSSDDKGIASWEWKLAPSDQDRAVDMQNTHSPYLQLSNLELGMYTFVLKVTDTSGQSSSAEVHVFVKEPPNKPPKANAGDDAAISLPQKWVVLDASKSTDEVQITSWSWKQIRGPNQAVLTKADQPQVNVSGLTKGEYEFLLTVWDINKNSDNDTVTVTVTQNENRRPHADGGGDQTVILPVSVVILNGSRSSDDVGIVKWEWIREGMSLAAGKIVGDSDKTPILELTDVAPGHYLFRLKVTDEQGASDENTVSVIIKQDPNLMDMVELVINVDLNTLTETQKATTLQQLALLLHEEGEIEVHLTQLREQPHSGHAVLVFYVERSKANGHKEVLRGPRILARLKEKLKHDEGLLQFSALSIDTVVCQNNCSRHGICDQASRECLCEAFWMENVLRRKLGDGEPNCDWSVLYVVIVIFVIILSVIGCTWAGVCLCQHWCEARRPKKKQHRYSLLNENQMEIMAKSKLMGSDSDSESDVLFESKKNRSNGITSKIGPSKGKNGFIKFGQRVKT